MGDREDDDGETSEARQERTRSTSGGGIPQRLRHPGLQEDARAAGGDAASAPVEAVDARRVKKQFERIVNSVERYYLVLGERHWVFHGSLNLDPLVGALDTNDADQVERAVIAQYQDEQKMKFALMRAKNVREMRPRAALLDAAHRDYQDGLFRDMRKGVEPIGYQSSRAGMRCQPGETVRRFCPGVHARTWERTSAPGCDVLQPISR